VSGADVQIACSERHDGVERWVATMRTDGQRHWLELAVEHRTLDGWRLGRKINFALSELWLLRDAIDRACALAGAVRR
jgi:hypothetical protein